MHVSISCYIVLAVFFKYSVSDDDVCNIETCLTNKNVVIFLKITGYSPKRQASIHVILLTTSRPTMVN